MDIQLYTEKVIIEAERDTSLVTLMKVDLGEIVGQVNTKELLDLMDFSEVADYVASKLEEDNE